MHMTEIVHFLFWSPVSAFFVYWIALIADIILLLVLFGMFCYLWTKSTQSSRSLNLVHAVMTVLLLYSLEWYVMAIFTFYHLYLDLHGLIFETSISLLVGSTRYLSDDFHIGWTSRVFKVICEVLLIPRRDYRRHQRAEIGKTRKLLFTNHPSETIIESMLFGSLTELLPVFYCGIKLGSALQSSTKHP